jgi:hypothetical protein
MVGPLQVRFWEFVDRCGSLKVRNIKRADHGKRTKKVKSGSEKAKTIEIRKEARHDPDPRTGTRSRGGLKRPPVASAVNGKFDLGR